jgi:dolichol-phosphate mannosyltransferase
MDIVNILPRDSETVRLFMTEARSTFIMVSDMNTWVLIPAYEPNDRLTELVTALASDARVDRIIVVNDGSTANCQPIFDAVSRCPNTLVLTHPVNRGKGAALKTALREAMSAPPDAVAVTIDADGQHRPDDMFAVLEALTTHREALILGARRFDLSNVPLKSRLGNTITRSITSYLIGQRITDTQTGLRAFHRQHFETLAKIDGDRYEYEMNVLLACGKLGIPLVEVPIETVYLDNNAASHFNPVLDSIRIYKRILRFSASSLISTGADLGLFTLLVYTLQVADPILWATLLARLVSVNLNFTLNKTLVFKSQAAWTSALIKYYSLAALQMLASYGLVKGVYTLIDQKVVLIKILVDLLLFIISYQIQKRYVFAHPHENT